MAMEKQLQAIAQRIKEMRTILDISAKDMADAIGCGIEEYREIEGGIRELSFTVLYKIAERLNMDINELVTGDVPRLNMYNLCRKGGGVPIKRALEGFEYYHLAPLMKNRFSEPYVVYVRENNGRVDGAMELLSHKGQEMDYVLKGTLKMQVDGHEEVLHEGDSIYYDSRQLHGMKAIGGDCKILAIVMKGENGIVGASDERISAKQSTDTDLIYKKFLKETLDKDGQLQKAEFTIPENFNFAFDVIDELAKKCPNKRALLWLSKDKEEKDFTFAQLSKLSSRVADYFTSLGIAKGDKVLLVLKRHYQFWLAILGLHKIGAVAIPATNQLMTKDYVYRLNKGGIKAVVAANDDYIMENLEKAKPSAPTLSIMISAGGEREGWRNFDEEIVKYSSVFPRPLDHLATDPMLWYFTSGTTGYPKLAMHDYTYALGHIITARWWHNVDPNGLHLTISDSGWAKAAWGKLYGQWLCEAGIFVYDFDRFDAHDLLPMFAKYQISTFCAPPTMYRFFIKEDISRYDLTSLKYATIAGEALNPEVYEQFYKATGLKLMEGFGQTETTLLVGNFIGMEARPGSMGKPSPQYKVELLNSSGKPTAVGEVGEIVLDTSSGKPVGMFRGYYDDEELTNKVWKNNFYHTGDMAWRDEDGYFWYVGRTDDLIKSSGYRIGPFEIESVIMELPYVLECAITGVPDEIRGQVVKATIILTKGTVGTDELKKEIQKYVKDKTAPYKYPRVVEFVTELPKTVSGKIKRAAIRKGEH